MSYTCEKCKYYDELNKFCTNPDIWIDVTESRYKIGCSRRSED